MTNKGNRQTSNSTFFQSSRAPNAPAPESPTTKAYKGMAQHPAHAAAALQKINFDLPVFT